MSLTFSNSVYPANENQVCLLLVVVDSLAGPALQLFPLFLPSALAPQKVYPVFPQLLAAVSFLILLARQTAL